MSVCVSDYPWSTPPQLEVGFRRHMARVCRSLQINGPPSDCYSAQSSHWARPSATTVQTDRQRRSLRTYQIHYINWISPVTTWLVHVTNINSLESILGLCASTVLPTKLTFEHKYPFWGPLSYQKKNISAENCSIRVCDQNSLEAPIESYTVLRANLSALYRSFLRNFWK